MITIQANPAKPRRAFKAGDLVQRRGTSSVVLLLEAHGGNLFRWQRFRDANGAHVWTLGWNIVAFPHDMWELFDGKVILENDE